MSVGEPTSEDETLLLDLLNSTPVRAGVPHDEFRTRRTAQAWMRQRGIPATELEWKSLIEARSILQAMVRGEQSAPSLAPLIDAITYRARATECGLVWELHVERTGIAAARAILAWDNLQRSSPGRLRPCANTECQRFLLDRSKSNTARWCSMAVCGNRMKARRHHDRARAAARSPNR